MTNTLRTGPARTATSYRNRARCRVLAAILASLLAGAACTTGPSVRDDAAVDIALPASTDFNVYLDNEVDPASRPGALAAEGARQGLEDCLKEGFPVLSLVVTPLCVAMGASTGAVTGAVVSAVTTLPDEEAAALARATVDALPARDWHAHYSRALAAEAKRRGKTVGSGPDTTRVHASIERLDWHIGVGNTAALRGRFSVGVIDDGRLRVRRFELAGRRRNVDAWSADNGAAIVAAMTALLAEAADRAWDGLDRPL